MEQQGILFESERALDIFRENGFYIEGKIVHFVMCELLGNPCETYKGMKNPIISLRKDYDR